MSGYNELTAWLELHGNVDVKPIVLTMYGREYHGASYTFVGHYEKGMDGVIRGTHKEGEEYLEDRMYFLGEVPKEYLKPKGVKSCYTLDGKTYYISSYMPKKSLFEDEVRRRRYHPFGCSFMLGQWPEKFGEIDAYEPKKYKRIPIQIKPAN